MNEYDNFGKDVEITISLNELMKILKMYDDNIDKSPCHVDDELGWWFDKRFGTDKRFCKKNELSDDEKEDLK